MNDDPVFVRPASTVHAPYVGALQAAAMRAVLAAEFPELDLADLVEDATVSQGWARTLAAPATPGRGVHVATEIDTPVGFVAFTDAAPGSGEGNSATEIVALEVEESARRKGHGSRMLAAVADMAREAGSPHLQVWLSPEEMEKIHFFQSAGFAPSGARRSLDVAGNPLAQHLWYATLS